MRLFLLVANNPVSSGRYSFRIQVWMRFSELVCADSFKTSCHVALPVRLGFFSHIKDCAKQAGTHEASVLPAD